MSGISYLQHGMIMYTEFNFEIWLRLVKFTDLILAKFFQSHICKLSLRSL